LLANGFVHNIDPVMAEPFGLRLYWYGCAYTIGFLGLTAWLLWRRKNYGWSVRDVCDAAIVFCLSILVCGRAFDIVVYEWDYYRNHPAQMIDWWQGGMASHGLLIGAAVAALVISRWKRNSFLQIADELVVPGALLLGVGRIGNFIEGGVIGTPTELPWGVKFPDVTGFRHPVALYDGAKNLLLIPLLIWVLRRNPSGSGRALAHFVFWYGALRFIVDQFRDYEAYVLGLGTGQYFNLAMALAGVVLLFTLHGEAPPQTIKSQIVPTTEAGRASVGVWRVVALALLILFPLGIPNSWTTANIAEKRGAAGADDVVHGE
jgi:phosphatidylglycerol:prolipoprotein diacylglycerol transferase